MLKLSEVKKKVTKASDLTENLDLYIISRNVFSN